MHREYTKHNYHPPITDQNEELKEEIGRSSKIVVDPEEETNTVMDTPDRRNKKAEKPAVAA